MLYIKSTGSFLKALVFLFGAFMAGERVLDYLKQNPNYSDNNFAKMLLLEDFNSKQIYGKLRQMIDRKGDQVSDKELEELSDVFRRTIAYERLILKDNYEGLKWFDG